MAGCPSGLEPATVESDPVAFDLAYHDYFESAYSEDWANLRRRVDPEDGALLADESVEFREAWRRHLLWPTTWRQVLPLFVFGKALEVDHNLLGECAASYCLLQAVPSMIADRALDEASSLTRPSDVAAGMIAVLKGLQTLRAIEPQLLPPVEDRFLSHALEMYSLMLVEHANRFKMLTPPYAELIANYVGERSRLDSSIFLGVLPGWAFCLARRSPPPRFLETFALMRRVRQLNDEIDDVEEDLVAGQLTLPWLYALESEPDLSGRIAELWQAQADPAALGGCTTALARSGGCERAAAVSLEWLAKSMNAVCHAWSPGGAFEISAIVNVRWAHLNRMAGRGFVPGPPPRQPKMPQRP